MKRLIHIIFLTALFAFSVQGLHASAGLVMLSGKVFTGDPAKPFAEAVAISGDRIIAVGTNKEVESFAGPTTRRIDLQGRVVVPGFNDAHFHFMPDRPGFHLQFKTQEPSWGETLEALKDAVQKTPKGEWIFGLIGINVLSDKSADRFALDRVAPQNPVLLRSYYGHGYIINSMAMSPLKLTEDEPDPVGGYFERAGDSKRINGRLWEYAEWKPNRILVAQVSDEQAIAELKGLADEAVRFGITSMQIMPSMPVDRFVKLLIKANLPIRVRAMPFAPSSPKGRDLSEFEMISELIFPNPKVKASGIKWILDGTPLERGAALRQPYNDLPGWLGRLNFPEAEIAKMIRESLGFKQQILFHCAGDKTAEAVFDAMDQVGGGKIDWLRKRLRIEHGDGIDSDLVGRAKRLGVIVVQNPSHFSLVDIIYARYSPNTKFFASRSLVEAGIPVAIGSDGPLNPFLNIMFAVINPARPAEALTREQAVGAYTEGSAYAEFAENEKGSLRKGKLADLAVLSQDIFNVPASELPNTHSIFTIVDGKIVYDAQALK